MTDELRVYNVDDPNDAPDRRHHLDHRYPFPLINPSLPTSLHRHVIEPVANSLYTAMQYYWYSAYQQGINEQRQRQQQQHQQQQQQQNQQQHQEQQLQLQQQQQHHQHYQQQYQPNPLHTHQEHLIKQEVAAQQLQQLNSTVLSSTNSIASKNVGIITNPLAAAATLAAAAAASASASTSATASSSASTTTTGATSPSCLLCSNSSTTSGLDHHHHHHHHNHHHHLLTNTTNHHLAGQDPSQISEELKQQVSVDSKPPSSAGSTVQMASSSSRSCSSSSSSSGASTTSNSPPSHHHNHNHLHHSHHGHHHQLMWQNNKHRHHNNNHLNNHHHHLNNHQRPRSVSSVEQEQPTRIKQEHIKKPLNPFMIFMQKQRPEIVRQGIIKESAAINQLLGQQWRKLTKEEQAPYYKLAEQEKIIHAQKYPGWSARDNYANQKKRKKLKLRSISLNGIDQSEHKKCRARFGLGNMSSWCKPCKRKKKCIYSIPKDRSNSGNNNHHNNDNNVELGLKY